MSTRMRGIAGLGPMQIETVRRFVCDSHRQRSNPGEGPPWYAEGWVRISGAWRSLSPLVARGLLEIKDVEPGSHEDWPRGTHGRRVRPTELALQHFGEHMARIKDGAAIDFHACGG